MDFSEWLMKELKERDLSQSDLSRKSGISQSQISLVLSGARKPGIEFCNAISKVFKLPLEDIYRHADLMPASIKDDEDQSTKEIVHLLNQMDKDSVQQVKDFVKFLANKHEKNNSAAENNEPYKLKVKDKKPS